VLAVAVTCFAGTLPAGVERFYDVGFRADLEFLGPGREERLDLYFPKNPAPGERFPGVVIIHGGGWAGGDKGDNREINIGSNLARAGYVCVSVNYVLSKRGKPSWPENIYDCKRAVQYLRVNAEELHVDAAHIGCIGGSAGGHLSAMVGVCGTDAKLEPPAPYPGVSSAVQAAVDLYGIADMLNWQYTRPDGTPTGKLRDGSQERMLGVTRDQNLALWKRASPIVQADPKDCPMLILHGRADSTVDYVQSVNFAKRLVEIGLEHECIIIDGARHTFDLRPQGTERVDVRKIVMSFYERHLRGLSRQAAAARYKALGMFEKEHPERIIAGPWSSGPSTVKEVAENRAFFVMSDGKTSSRIALGPRTVYAVQRLGSVAELKNLSLVLLRGNKSRGADAFQVTSLLCYAPGYNAWQSARDDRILGRWYRKGDTLQVSVRGKKQPIALGEETDVSIRLLAKPDLLKAGAQIIKVRGKRLGSDLYASRVVVSASGSAGNLKASSRTTPVALLWADPRIETLTGIRPRGVSSALSKGGLNVQLITTEQLTDKRLLNTDNADVVVLPYGGCYPAGMTRPITDFLKKGGAYITLGGKAFREPVYLVDNQWRASRKPGAQRIDISLSPAWKTQQCATGEELAMVARKDGSATFGVSDLTRYTYTGTGLPRLSTEDNLLCFEARGDSNTPVVCIELQEGDGSRWKSAVRLSEAWRRHRIHVGDMRSYASDQRGGRDDYYHPEKGTLMLFGFTKRMVGEGKHQFELRDVHFSRSGVSAATVVGTSVFTDPDTDVAQWYSRLGTTRSVPGISCFAKSRKVFGSGLHCTAPDFPVPAADPVAGDWFGQSVGSWWSGARRSQKEHALIEHMLNREATVRFPLLALNPGGPAEQTVAALLLHRRGEFAGSRWCSFGLDCVDLTAPRCRVVSDMLSSVARFCSRGLSFGELRPSWRIVNGVILMDVELSFLNSSNQKATARVSIVTTTGKILGGQSRDVRIPARCTASTPIMIAEGIPMSALNWQDLELRAEVEAKGVPVIGQANYSLNTRRSLRDIGDFLVEAGADDAKFHGYSFVDSRGARGLLGAYDILGDGKYRDAALAWGKAMLDEQREDGGYRMGYGIGAKGEACYVADGGEIAVAMIRLVSYTSGELRERYLESLRKYMGFRENFRVEGGGIGVGWCLHDFGKRPILPLDVPRRIFAPERNTYTVGCSLAAAYAFARLTGKRQHEAMAEVDADWLMPRTELLSGAFCESYFWAHA
ncbi:MAG: alpha/beta hydrolase, partial [Lentisphaeria bacterium]|nr:alpha/beta hydrolase [Lentisphaeria bacterium]